MLPLLEPQVAGVVVELTAVGAGYTVTVDVVMDVHPPEAVTVCDTLYVPADGYVTPVTVPVEPVPGVPPVNTHDSVPTLTPVFVKVKELPLKH